MSTVPTPTPLAPGLYSVPEPPPPPQPPQPVKIVQNRLLALQRLPFSLLWGVGRSVPIPNPPVHGTATYSPGEPGLLDFHPANLGGPSDNLYCLLQLAMYLQQADIAKATTFTESCVLSVDKPANVQALETDFHVQLGQSIWNPGLQLLPTGQIRAFDYIRKDWVPLPGCTFDPAQLTSGVSLAAEYQFTPEELIFTAVNGTPVTFSQPVAKASGAAFVFNKAIQADAKASGAAYQLRVGKMEVAFS